jgi:TRAP-type C4-dicarboxylate transport system permease large subunit
VGGVLLGWFTPTESAAWRAVHGGAVDLRLPRAECEQIYTALADTGGSPRGALLRRHRLGLRLAARLLPDPRALLENVSTWGMGITQAGFFIAFVFLVVGCFLDAIPAIIIFGTILQPLANSVGMHPIHFAIIGIVSLAFGLVTPPYGLCLMIACSVAKVPIRFALQGHVIMLVPMLRCWRRSSSGPRSADPAQLIAPELLKVRRNHG